MGAGLGCPNCLIYITFWFFLLSRIVKFHRLLLFYGLDYSFIGQANALSLGVFCLMVGKLVGFNHHIGNSYSAVRMDVTTLLKMIERGASVEEMASVTARLKRTIYEFPNSMTSILELADFVGENGFTRVSFDNGETLDLTRADEVCSLYNWMKRKEKTMVDVLPLLS